MGLDFNLRAYYVENMFYLFLNEHKITNGVILLLIVGFIFAGIFRVIILVWMFLWVKLHLSASSIFFVLIVSISRRVIENTKYLNKTKKKKISLNVQPYLLVAISSR